MSNFVSILFLIFVLATMFYWKLSVKKLSGRKRNISKARNLVMNGRNLNNAFELTESIDLLNKGMREAFRLVRARRIGKSVIRRLKRAHKFVFVVAQRSYHRSGCSEHGIRARDARPVNYYRQSNRHDGRSIVKEFSFSFCGPSAAFV